MKGTYNTYFFLFSLIPFVLSLVYWLFIVATFELVFIVVIMIPLNQSSFPWKFPYPYIFFSYFGFTQFLILLFQMKKKNLLYVVCISLSLVYVSIQKKVCFSLFTFLCTILSKHFSYLSLHIPSWHPYAK